MAPDALSNATPNDEVPTGAGQEHVSYVRSKGHMALEIFGISAAIFSVGLLLWRSVAGVLRGFDGGGVSSGPVLLATMLTSIFAGYLFADFASGVVHFLFDRFFSLDTPLLGKNFVHPFRQHHSDPKHITRHDFIETNGNNCLATCPFLFALIAIPFDYTVPWQLFFVGLIVFSAVGTFGTNQFHKWAHADDPPHWVGWLQDHSVILPRRHHQIHHSHPYDTHYCITTGWLNGPLAKIHFWKFLEWFGTRVARLQMFTEATP